MAIGTCGPQIAASAVRIVGSGYAGIAEFMIVTVLGRIFSPKSSRSWNGFYGAAIIRFLAG
jgi:hypothetical protein